MCLLLNELCKVDHLSSQEGKEINSYRLKGGYNILMIKPQLPQTTKGEFKSYSSPCLAKSNEID